MTKVTTSIFPTVFSSKPARFAGNWLARAATSRSARRRLNAILRFACRTLGLKRGKGLGMLGMAAVLAVGLASPVLAQTASPVVASSPDIGQLPSPAGILQFNKGFTFMENTQPDRSGDVYPAQMYGFIVRKGSMVTGKLTSNGVQIPTGVLLDRDYVFKYGTNTQFDAGTTIHGPVSIDPNTPLTVALRFPAGTIIPVGTKLTAGKVPDWVQPGVPTNSEFAVARVTTYISSEASGGGHPITGSSMDFPAVDKIPAGRDLRFTQIKINTDANSKPATTSTDVPGDIAIGSGSTATGAKDAAGVSAPATSIGENAKAKGAQSTAIGASTEAASKAAAVGGGARATGESSLAIGNGAQAADKMGVALGAGSTTEAVHPVDKEVVLNGKAYAIDSSKTIGVVSTGTANAKRQIINVAPGKVSADSTDATNGSQLNAAYDGINQLGTVVKDQGERLTKAEGSIVKQGDTLTKQGDRLTTTEGTVAKQGGRIDELNTTVKDQDARLSSAEDTLTNQGNRLTTATKNIADQGGKIATLNTTVKGQGDALKTQGEALVDQGGKIGALDTTVKGQGETLKMQGDKIAEQGGKLDTLKQELISGKTGLVQDDATNGKLAIGAGSDAKTVDFSGVTPKLDAGGKPVVGTDGKTVMETADRVLTGVRAAMPMLLF